MSFGETFGETFGAATGVSDPRLQMTQTRNNGAGGKAATVAGYAGPGFHTWPPGHIPQDTDPNPLLRSRPLAKKTFGEAFGAATGVSDPRLQKIRIQNNCAGGQAATVAGHVGPGFHTWPQATSFKRRIRNRFHVSGPLLKRRSERRSAPRPGSATHGYRRTSAHPPSSPLKLMIWMRRLRERRAPGRRRERLHWEARRR